MIISTSGFGNTGASAVLDFLRGYPDIQVLDGIEFQLITMPDGLLDLKHALVNARSRLGGNAALKRFMRLEDSLVARRLKAKGCDYAALARDFVAELDPVTWQGASGYDPRDVANRRPNPVARAAYHYARKLNPNLHPRFETRYFLMPEEAAFDAAARRFIGRILDSLGIDRKRDVALDMLVNAVDPGAGLEFVDDTRVIIVYRDPVDLFIRATTHQSTNGFFPCADVEAFIRYYRTLMTRTRIGGDALCVQYEDLIYRYYPTTRGVMDFLGYPSRPRDEFKYFNPDVSVKYTNTRDTFGDKAAIARIEAELAPYLYAFPAAYTPVEKQPR